MSMSRRGLNLLLNEYPLADVVHVDHQGYRHEYAIETLTRDDTIVTQGDGPWTQVTMKDASGFREFAIWNRTGAVYHCDKYGAVADDPFLTPRDYGNQNT
jgi:hypothetical protein